MTICEYCSRLAKYQFKNGVSCCSSHPTRCPEQQKIRTITRDKKSESDKAKSIEKNKRTKMLHHGDPNFNNRESAKKTMLEKYGEDNASKVQSIKLKKDETFDRNFRQQPTEHEKLIHKKQETWKKKDIEIVNQKRVDTCLEKYGVSNPLQVLEIFEKTQKSRWKNFIFPSGKEEKIQGSERFAIIMLLENHSEDDIEVDRKKIPSIWYEFEGKRRRYYPDIYIKSENKIIEVKSTWTYDGKPDFKTKNLAKKKACINAGYEFEFWVFGKNNQLIKNHNVQN